MRFLKLSTLASTALILSACGTGGTAPTQGGPSPTPPPETTPPPAVAPALPSVQEQGAIAGTVMVPAATARSFGILAVEEAPAANVEVFLVDQAGNPVPNSPRTTTDAQGNFTLSDIPADRTLLLAAQVQTRTGGIATFQTLTRTTAGTTDANINAATTMVSTTLVETTQVVGPIELDSYRQAVSATSRNLTADQLPDFSSRADVVAKTNALATTVEELRTALASLRGELDALRAEVEQLKAGLPRPQPGQPPEAAQAYCQFSFFAIDQNSDGSVSRNEWSVAMEGRGRGEVTFEATDENYDGIISYEEFSETWCEDEEDDEEKVPQQAAGTTTSGEAGRESPSPEDED